MKTTSLRCYDCPKGLHAVEQRTLSIARRVQHMANGGINSTNPGLDMIGLAFSYDSTAEIANREKPPAEHMIRNQLHPTIPGVLHTAPGRTDRAEK